MSSGKKNRSRCRARHNFQEIKPHATKISESLVAPPAPTIVEILDPLILLNDFKIAKILKYLESPQEVFER